MEIKSHKAEKSTITVVNINPNQISQLCQHPFFKDKEEVKFVRRTLTVQMTNNNLLLKNNSLEETSLVWEFFAGNPSTNKELELELEQIYQSLQP